MSLWTFQEILEKRRQLMIEFRNYREEKEDEFAMLKDRRLALRGGLFHNGDFGNTEPDLPNPVLRSVGQAKILFTLVLSQAVEYNIVTLQYMYAFSYLGQKLFFNIIESEVNIPYLKFPIIKSKT